jgi:lipopolysaccharide transport system permease protein
MKSSTNPNAMPPTGFAAFIRSLAGHRALIAQLVRREVISRYRGSVMGLAWSFFSPLLMLAVYTFVFSVVFNARWGVASGGRGEFAIFLFAGLIVHGLFAECLTRAPTLILSNPSYVKRVVFPLEVLPWVGLGSAIFHSIISLLVLIAAQLVILGSIPSTALFIPFVAIPLVLMTAGAAWLLAGFGVYMRDINHVIGIIVTVLLFMSPVFYPVDALQEPFRFWLYLNPLTFIIEQFRDLLIVGRSPRWSGLAAYAGASLAFAWFGFAVFQKLRRGFADVL